MGKNSAPGGWLFKQEPACYSYDDLARDGGTLWDGVANALARQNLRRTRSGDRVLYYHTGKERAIVGEMRVSAEPRADPTSDDPRAVVVAVEAVRRWPHPVTLDQIKADPLFIGWELVRQPRLSVLPVSPQQWQRLEALAESGAT